MNEPLATHVMSFCRRKWKKGTVHRSCALLVRRAGLVSESESTFGSNTNVGTCGTSPFLTLPLNSHIQSVMSITVSLLHSVCSHFCNTGRRRVRRCRASLGRRRHERHQGDAVHFVIHQLPQKNKRLHHTSHKTASHHNHHSQISESPAMANQSMSIQYVQQTSPLQLY